MFRHKLLSMVIMMGLLVSQSVPHAMAATLCDSAQFVSDLTVPDGTSFAPGATFTKTWRLANNGTCTWNTSYSVVWVNGSQMGTTSVKVPVSVAPGQMVDISINLTAPATIGHFTSLWKLSNASGIQFGIGSSGVDAFWVDINVVDTRTVIYDFVTNAPYAEWKSGAGVLPFPGSSGDYRGYSNQVNNPHLEDDSYDSLPGLLVVPQNKYNGYIQAMYPEFQVQAGDKLQTLVNCEFGATGCYVTFRIDYLLPNHIQKTLWTWKEAPDKRFYRANLDLSSLAGQKVRFVFMLLSSGTASGDRAVWGSPRIIRTGTSQPPALPATLTPLPPLTATATPFTPPPPTMAPAGCDRASFVADVTIQDGTRLVPGEAFTKTWRLKNNGSCVWTTSYKLVYYSGTQMSAPTMVNLPWGATYGQTVDVSVNMVAPMDAGSYRGYWILANASGQYFGIGASASNPVWVDITVAGEATYEGGYNFWSNACAAEWRSGSGPLPCPGTEGDNKGFVIPLQYSHLEDGTMGPAPTFLMAPENKYNGYIQGVYPTFTVQPGDHFFTATGCEYGYSCYVTFRLDYMTSNGGIFNFWSWREQNDKQNHMASVDLTPLAGRSVRFILTILATGSATGDRVRWTGPMIIRTAPTTPPTITPSPTYTPIPPSGMPGTLVPLPLIDDLSMLDANNGWAMSRSYVLRTNTAGMTWYNVTAPGAMGNITGGTFRSTNNGWMLTDSSEFDAGSLYRTTDGGFNWTHYDVPFRGGKLQFLDNLNGFVLAGEPSGMHKQAVQLYQTSDGGATWTLKYANNPTIPGDTLPFGGLKFGLTFRDTSTGWIGGYSPETGAFYLYKTTNGGVTWARQQLALPAGYESADITVTAPTFFSANDAILPVWMTIGIGQRDLFLYVTHDGGTSWSRSTSLARNGQTTEFVSMRDVFTWNSGGYLQVTNDSGANWRQVTSNVTFGENVAGMDFVSPTIGWILEIDENGNRELYRTIDGGVTWTLLFGVPAPPAPVYLPDLTITGMHIELKNTSCFDPADTMGVRIWIKNNGNTIAPAFSVSVNNVEQTTPSWLGIGETTILFFPGYGNPVTTIVDPANAIQESDETNNIRSEMVPVPTAPLPCVITPAAFAQNLVNMLNARNFDALPAMMDQSLGFAYWQSQGTSYPSDEAIQSLRTGLTVTLIPNAGKDLNSLLDGLDPYAIMGLDPSKSFGLFVSGWGSNTNAEAILYVTQRADGSLYWHSVLIAPTGFAPPVTLTGPYAVVGVASNDVLNIRSGAGVSYHSVGSFAPDAINVMRTGSTANADNAAWVEVQNPSGGTGWVNSFYLTEYVTHDAFCADTRIASLLEQLKDSMDQSNGDMFASLISPPHGVSIHRWAYEPPVVFSTDIAKTAFISTTSYAWGYGPRGGPDPETGTFAQIIQPKLQEVFNDSNLETYCDNLTNVFPLARPWPYTNIRYYNLHKPSSGQNLDFRTWLIGIEYINGQPYLYALVNIQWEP